MAAHAKRQNRYLSPTNFFRLAIPLLLVCVIITQQIIVCSLKHTITWRVRKPVCAGISDIGELLECIHLKDFGAKTMFFFAQALSYSASDLEYHARVNANARGHEDMRALTDAQTRRIEVSLSKPVVSHAPFKQNQSTAGKNNQPKKKETSHRILQ